MPRRSDRELAIADLQECWLHLSLLDTVLGMDTHREIDDVHDALVACYASRYFAERIAVPKASNRFGWLFSELDDYRFKQELRMYRDSFFRLLELLRDHPVFHPPPGKKPQLPVHIQLTIALIRMGTHGNGSSVDKVACLCSVSGSSLPALTASSWTLADSRLSQRVSPFYQPIE